jgi:hypothetical protein
MGSTAWTRPGERDGMTEAQSLDVLSTLDPDSDQSRIRPFNPGNASAHPPAGAVDCGLIEDLQRP